MIVKRTLLQFGILNNQTIDCSADKDCQFNDSEDIYCCNYENGGFVENGYCCNDLDESDHNDLINWISDNFVFFILVNLTLMLLLCGMPIFCYYTCIIISKYRERNNPNARPQYSDYSNFGNEIAIVSRSDDFPPSYSNLAFNEDGSIKSNITDDNDDDKLPSYIEVSENPTEFEIYEISKL